MTRTASCTIHGDAALWPEVVQAGLLVNLFGDEWWMISRQQGLEPFDKDFLHINEEAAVSGLTFLQQMMWVDTVLNAVYQNKQTPSEAMAAVVPAINAKLAEWATQLSSSTT